MARAFSENIKQRVRQRVIHMNMNEQTSDESALNKNTIRALFCTVFMLFPIAAIFAAFALFSAVGKKNWATAGLAFALFIVNGVLVPGAAWAVIYGRPPGIDSCLKNQDTIVGPLRLVHHLQEEYRDKNGRYGTFEEISWDPKVGTKPYKVKLVYAKQDTFKVVAIGEGIMDGDEHFIDEKRIVKKVRDLCSLRR